MASNLPRIDGDGREQAVIVSVAEDCSGQQMATYADIRDWVKREYGFVPKSCWIAHCKKLAGIPVRRAWNRVGEGRAVPCPEAKRYAIECALRHFKMV